MPAVVAGPSTGRQAGSSHCKACKSGGSCRTVRRSCWIPRRSHSRRRFSYVRRTTRSRVWKKSCTHAPAFFPKALSASRAMKHGGNAVRRVYRGRRLCTSVHVQPGLAGSKLIISALYDAIRGARAPSCSGHSQKRWTSTSAGQARKLLHVHCLSGDPTPVIGAQKEALHQGDTLWPVHINERVVCVHR